MRRHHTLVALLLLLPCPLLAKEKPPPHHAAAGSRSIPPAAAPRLAAASQPAAAPHAVRTLLMRPYPDSSPFAVNLAIDVPLTVAGLASSAAPMFAHGPLVQQLEHLSPTTVNGLDRTVIGNHSQAAETASNVLLGASLSLPYVAEAIDQLLSPTTGDRLQSFGKDSLVLLETMAINLALVDIVKYAVRRPRPYVYAASTSDADRSKTDASLSFYSGHTALTFSMATAYSYLFMHRHPHSPLVPWIWAGSYAAATTTGVMRVLAGQHFWSDVIVGAAAGTATGLLIPMLHHHLAPRDQPRFLDSLRVVPETYHGGFGVGVKAHW